MTALVGNNLTLFPVTASSRNKWYPKPYVSEIPFHGYVMTLNSYWGPASLFNFGQLHTQEQELRLKSNVTAIKRDGKENLYIYSNLWFSILAE